MNFDQIPVDWLEPGVFMEVKPNYSTAGVLPYPTKALIIGQKLAAGTLAPGQIVEVVRADQAIALFGLGSIGAQQVAAFRANNTTSPLYVMALSDDAEGVAATGTITLGGSISASLVLRFLIAGQQVRFTATAGATVTELATALAAAINVNATLPVTAAAAAGVVTVTCRHKGEVGNDITLKVDTAAQPLPTGLTATIAAMAGGSGNPDIEDALDVVANTWVTHVAHPWNDTTNMTAFAAWLEERYEAMTKLDVLGFVAKAGTYAQLGTWGELTNCAFLSLAGVNKSPTSSWVVSAAIAGLAAFHLTNDPARQLRSLTLTGVVAPDAADQFIDVERELLLRKGVSSLDCLSDGSVTISRLITTYKTSDLGVADRAWLDVMVAATMSRIRYDWASYVSLLYPRAKLADDESEAAFAGRSSADEAPGTSIVTPRRMKATWGGRCRLYAEQGWIEDIETTIKQSAFERSTSDRNRLESRQQIRIIGNLMVLAGSLEFQV